jgi:hypothetical protein
MYHPLADWLTGNPGYVALYQVVCTCVWASVMGAGYEDVLNYVVTLVGGIGFFAVRELVCFRYACTE